MADVVPTPLVVTKALCDVAVSCVVVLQPFPKLPVPSWSLNKPVALDEFKKVTDNYFAVLEPARKLKVPQLPAQVSFFRGAGERGGEVFWGGGRPCIVCCCLGLECESQRWVGCEIQQRHDGEALKVFWRRAGDVSEMVQLQHCPSLLELGARWN